jgi:hypothetical protein
MKSGMRQQHRISALLLVLFVWLAPAIVAAADRTAKPAQPAFDETYTYGTASQSKSPAYPTAGQRPVTGGTATLTPTAPAAAQTQSVIPAQPVAERSYYSERPGNQPVTRVADAPREPRRTEFLPVIEPGKGNEVFFRGGYVAALSDRRGEVFTDTYTRNNPADKGYYVGAGLDLLLTRDVWGMMNGASVLGEINVEYKRFNSNQTQVAVPSVATNSVVPGKVQVTMLTVSVSPKIKFNEGSAFRPWIIPIGMDFQVISPPSNQTQYLDIGAQFGAGAEYQVWKEFKVGVDFRFHLTANQTQTVNSFWTLGPYVGIGF